MGNQSLVHQGSSAVARSAYMGMAVTQSYQAASGFNYMAGVRELEGLIIVEAVAEGVGASYLCAIRILNKADKTLVAEIDVPKGVRYSRQKCVELVSDKLFEVILDSARKQGQPISERQARQKIDSLLDNCYFEQSRKSVLAWAASVGII
ncbi:MAG: hypothetical protein ACK5LR_07450 [Mangrovibacterium sp.]